MNEEEKKKYHRKYNKSYYQRHKEVIKKRSATYRKTEEYKGVLRKYLKTEKGKRVQKRASARYYGTKKGKEAERKATVKYGKSKKCKKTTHNFYLENKEKIEKRVVKYRKTKNGKLMRRKTNSKRRSLGFVELNESFPNSDAHHIDKEFVIYIPKEMHRLVYHNIFTGKGMEEINDKAIDFCYGD